MIKQKIYSVLDTKMGTFGGMFLDMTDDSAMRNFSDGVNDPNPQNRWYRHSEDFALYRLGIFDQTTGEIVPEQKLVCVCTASAVKSDKKVLEAVS